MIELNSKLRKWGNSFGIVIPQSLVKGNLKENEEVKIFISPKEDSIKDLFGKLKKWKINSQNFKDEIRRDEK